MSNWSTQQRKFKERENLSIFVFKQEKVLLRTLPIDETLVGGIFLKLSFELTKDSSQQEKFRKIHVNVLLTSKGERKISKNTVKSEENAHSIKFVKTSKFTKAVIEMTKSCEQYL